MKRRTMMTAPKPFWLGVLAGAGAATALLPRSKQLREQMLFRQLIDSESSTYTYLLADRQTKEAVLIDAVLEHVDRDLKLLDELGLRLVYVLDTHVHADHVTASGTLARRTGARSVAGRHGAPCVDIQVEKGDQLQFGHHKISVLETPGHTDNSVSYRVGDRVFTGDALLVRGCGRTDFQNGDPAQLYHSITQVLFSLPDETLVFPAHDYRGHTMTTIGEEKRHNPRVAGKSEAEFIELMHNLDLSFPKKIMEAVPKNLTCGLGTASQEDIGRTSAPQGVQRE